MQKEITFEDAKNIIDVYGIDEDKYIMQHYHQFMNGNNDADDNTIESSDYFKKCLKIIVAEGLKANSGAGASYKENAGRAINILIADAEKQLEKALRNSDYTSTSTTTAYRNGLEVAKNIIENC